MVVCIELALYVLPRALDSLYMIMNDRRIFTGVRNGEILLFSLSMAWIMYGYEVCLYIMIEHVVDVSLD